MGRLIDSGGAPGRWVRALVVVLLAVVLASCASGGATSTGTGVGSGSAPAAGTPGSQSGATGPSAMPLSGGNNAIDGAWFVDSNDGWVIGKRCGSGTGATQNCTGAIIHTTDGGKTWSDQSFPEVLPCKVQFLDGQNGWIIGVYGPNCNGQQMQNGVVLGTNDGGAHWTERYLSGLLITDLAFTTPDSGWVFAQTCSGSKQVPGCLWQLIQTADAGHNWQQTVLPLKAANLDISRPTAQDGWAVDRGPVGPGSSATTLIATHDGGHTWNPIKDPAGSSWAATACSTPMTAAGSGAARSSAQTTPPLPPTVAAPCTLRTNCMAGRRVFITSGLRATEGFTGIQSFQPPRLDRPLRCGAAHRVDFRPVPAAGELRRQRNNHVAPSGVPVVKRRSVDGDTRRQEADAVAR